MSILDSRYFLCTIDEMFHKFNIYSNFFQFTFNRKRINLSNCKRDENTKIVKHISVYLFDHCSKIDQLCFRRTEIYFIINPTFVWSVECRNTRKKKVFDKPCNCKVCPPLFLMNYWINLIWSIGNVSKFPTNSKKAVSKNPKFFWAPF